MKNVNKEDVMSKAMMAYVANDHYYYPSAGMSVTACRVKRVADVIVSLLALIIFSPVFLLISWLIKHEDGGPVIFSQERIGYGGKPFILYKFRSMSVDSESDGKPALCQKNDCRLTRIGRFLREHHLDELPQLWNVLKGEMSFVGPRPERKYFVDKIKAINPDYELLYRLRPGLFSKATLYNGYTDTMEKCWNVLEWIWNICVPVLYGWILKSYGLRPCPFLWVKNSNSFDMNKIEIRKGIQLRKIGNRYMIVDACAGNVNMSKVYSLNQTAAWIWQCVADGCTTLDELTERLCQEYKVDAEVARRDLEKQLADWQAFGLIG